MFLFLKDVYFEISFEIIEKIYVNKLEWKSFFMRYICVPIFGVPISFI